MYFLRIAPQPWGVWLGRYEQRPMPTVCSMFVIPESASNVLCPHLSAPLGSLAGAEWQTRVPCACFLQFQRARRCGDEPEPASYVLCSHSAPAAMGSRLGRSGRDLRISWRYASRRWYYQSLQAHSRARRSGNARDGKLGVEERCSQSRNTHRRHASVTVRGGKDSYRTFAPK
jgi:hypothetical protein